MKTYNNFNKLQCSSHRTWNMDESGFSSEIPSGQMIHLNCKRSLHKDLARHIHTTLLRWRARQWNEKRTGSMEDSFLSLFFLHSTNIFKWHQCVPGTVPGSWDTPRNRRQQFPPSGNQSLPLPILQKGYSSPDALVWQGYAACVTGDKACS